MEKNKIVALIISDIVQPLRRHENDDTSYNILVINLIISRTSIYFFNYSKYDCPVEFYTKIDRPETLIELVTIFQYVVRTTAGIKNPDLRV